MAPFRFDHFVKVDGWTLPFRLSISGDCSGPNDAHPTEIDCSGFRMCGIADL